MERHSKVVALAEGKLKFIKSHS